MTDTPGPIALLLPLRPLKLEWLEFSEEFLSFLTQLGAPAGVFPDLRVGEHVAPELEREPVGAGSGTTLR